jgi:hypothetical protein
LTIPTTAPVIVSFYCGDVYYALAAERLRADCERLGYDHDIVEMIAKPSETWADICRRKAVFHLEMHRKHGRPILWLDVDSRLGHRVTALDGARYDMAGFLRGLRYLRGFDPMGLPRFFSPFALYFNQTPAATRFLERMAELEAAHPGPATDDYFLQEAWASHEQEMSVLVLPPKLVGRQWPLDHADQCIYVGISGNVSAFKEQVQQHVAPAATPSGRKKALLVEGAAALSDRDLALAEFFYSRALAVGGRDDGLAGKVARVIRRRGQLPDAIAFLHRYQQDQSSVDLATRFEIDSEIDAGRFDAARRLCASLLRSVREDDVRWAEATLLRVELESRARVMGVEADQRLRLDWDSTQYIGYVGDLVPIHLAERLTGVPPMLVAASKGAIQVGGSRLGTARSGQHAWGSGISSIEDMLHPHVRYHLVRGPLTRQRVRDGGGTCPEDVGHPAWLFPQIHPVGRKSVEHAAGLALHPADVGLVRHSPGVHRISTRCTSESELLSFISALHSCACVLTTSLTTLALCHAYGIPAHWLLVQKRTASPVSNDEVRDYLLSIGVEPQQSLAIDAGGQVGPALCTVDESWLPIRPLDLKVLVDTAPFKIRRLCAD